MLFYNDLLREFLSSCRSEQQLRDADDDCYSCYGHHNPCATTTIGIGIIISSIIIIIIIITILIRQSCCCGQYGFLDSTGSAVPMGFLLHPFLFSALLAVCLLLPLLLPLLLLLVILLVVGSNTRPANFEETAARRAAVLTEFGTFELR